MNKKRQSYKKIFRYVCEPNSMSIVAQDSTKHRAISVSLYIEDKEVITNLYRVRTMEKKEVNDRVIEFCDGIVSFSEEAIQRWSEQGRVSLALFANRSLKEVRNKLGTLIWRK